MAGRIGEYKNITFEYKEFQGLGKHDVNVRVSSSEDKFTILPNVPTKNEIRNLLDEVYSNMASELRRQMYEKPESWFNIYGSKSQGKCGLKGIIITPIRKFIPDELGGYNYLKDLVIEKNFNLFLKVIDRADDISLVHCIKNNRVFCLNQQKSAFQLLNEASSSENFFENFCHHYFPNNALQKKRWVGSYFNKICEAMSLKGWLLYPLMKIPTIIGTYFFRPHLEEGYINTNSQISQELPNKVFVKNFDEQRIENFKNMGRIIIRQQKADGSDCYGFIRRLTYMTDAKGVGGLSEKLCIYLTSATVSRRVVKKIRDSPVERLVNDYLREYRQELKKLPTHLFVYQRRLKKELARKNKNLRNDGTFQWASKKQPLLINWVRYFKQFVPESTLQNVNNIATALNPFLDWLLVLKTNELKQVKEPENIDRFIHFRRYNSLSESNLSITFFEYLEQNVSNKKANMVLNELEKFYLWFAKTHNRYCEIPVNLNDRKGFQTQYREDKSNKEVIPTRLFKLMKQILIADNYAWAKKINSDWTGRTAGKGTWCPSRTIMLETMMTLPIRYSNCQSADLGLLDEHWYNDILKRWELNPTGIKGRQAGIFQQLGDIGKGKNIIGFYFPQSKTTSDGLTVTWDNNSLRKKLLELRQFVLENNAVFDHSLIRGMSEKGKVRFKYRMIQPLFIDFAHRDHKYSREPVSYERLTDFFKLLQVETERRFNLETESGRKNPLKLIYSWKKYKTSPPRPLTTLFTLHCLRVTGITNFSLAGLEPAVIAEMLSGHSSIAMNLFYTKYGVSLINKLVSEKAHEIDINPDLISLEDWRDDLDFFRRIIEVNSENDAFDKIDKKNFYLMTFLDGFICPNSGTRCDEGNLNLKLGSKATQVQGGKGNCPKCRFAMTGPMLLVQQILTANKKLFELQEIVEKQNKHYKKADEFQLEGNEASERAHNNMADSMQAEIDMRMDSWLSRISFINKSVSKLTVWDKIKSMRVEGFSKDDIKNAIEKSSVEEKTLITMASGEDVVAGFEKCETRAEQIAINACAEQILQMSNTSCTDKLILLLTRALIKNGSEPFIMQLDEVNRGKAAALHAQFLSKYLQVHAEFNMVKDIDHDFNSQGLAAMGKFLESSGDEAQLPVDVKRAWDAINKIIINVGKEEVLPVSLTEMPSLKKQLNLGTFNGLAHGE